MIRKRIGRFATIITAASLTLMVLGVGAVSAKNPSWAIAITKLPPTVGAGHDAGYQVTVSNSGPSNINTLSMVVTPAATPTAAPTYFSGLTWNFGDHGSCTGTGPGGSGPLTCDLGTLSALQAVTFTVAYLVPAGSTGSFDVTVAIQSGSGNTGSDPGSSRGDAFSKTASTGISSSQNFDGGFSVDGDTYQTTGSLGRNNKQSTTLETTGALIPVTIQDGITTGVSCTIPACANLIGEWSKLDVNGGQVFGTPFKVTLLVWGGAVPGGVSASDIFVLHTLDNGTTVEINTPCTPTTGTPTNPECLTVTKVGSNFKIVVWLFQNGNARGGY